MRFEGEFSVEDGDFELSALPLIVRKNEVAFTLIGLDEFGNFSLEGTARETEHGFYLASRVRLIYPDYDSEDYEEYATIRLDTISVKSSGKECDVSGIWRQVKGEEWKFDGTLRVPQS